MHGGYPGQGGARESQRGGSELGLQYHLQLRTKERRVSGRPAEEAAAVRLVTWAEGGAFSIDGTWF